MPEVNAYWTTLSKFFLYTEFTAPPGEAREIAEKMRQFYLGNREINNSTLQRLTQVIIRMILLFVALERF